MEFDQKSLSEATNIFIKESEKFRENLDSISDSIRDAELIFTNVNINLPFRYLIEEKENGTTVEFTWDHDENSNRFRIKLEVEGHGKDAGRIILNRPFIETKITIRLELFKHLEPFIRSFTEFIKNKRIEAQKKITEDKLEI